MDIHSLERHPLSAIWGDMTTELFEALKADIAEVGVRTPITLYEGKVLDGWHRLRAAIENGEDHVPTRDLPADEDPVDFVIRENALRRPLPKGQRVAIILQARRWRSRGRPSLSEKAIARTDQQLAEEAGASVGLVKATKKAFRDGHGEDIAAGRETLRSIQRKERAREKATQTRPLTAMEKAHQKIADLELRIDALTAEDDQAALADGLRAEIVCLKAEVKEKQDRILRLTQQNEHLRQEIMKLKPDTGEGRMAGG